MRRRLQVRRRARRDVEAAAEWYERERPGLGDEFIDELDSLLARVVKAPAQFPIVMEETRRALVRRFPFAVYFVADDERVIVLAIVHLHRHPDAWKRSRGKSG